MTVIRKAMAVTRFHAADATRIMLNPVSSVEADKGALVVFRAFEVFFALILRFTGKIESL
jgi:hypothetical protein